MKRSSLNGTWILDKSRGDEWKMNNYLATMDVDPLAIEAHEKGEMEHDTIHTITLTDRSVEIIKQSRVNNQLRVQLVLGEESADYLPPGNRPKKSLARSDHLGHVEIVSSLLTVNGMAQVKDVKNLVQESDEKSVMVQELTITNEATGKSCTTIRHFLPYNDE